MFNQFIDVGQRMRDIKRNIKKRKDNYTQNKEFNVTDCESFAEGSFYSREIDWRNRELLVYRAEIEEHKNIGSRIPLCLKYNKIQRKLLKIIARVINKLSYVITKDQNITNHHLLLSTDRLRESVQLLNQQNEELEIKTKVIVSQQNQIEELYSLVQNITSEINSLKSNVIQDEVKMELEEKIEDLEQIVINVPTEIDKIYSVHERELQEMAQIIRSETDRGLKNIEHSIEENVSVVINDINQVEEELYKMQESILSNKNEFNSLKKAQEKAISRQQQMLNRYMHMDEIVMLPPREKIVNSSDDMMYEVFENKYRGSEEVIRERLEEYIKYLNKTEQMHYKCLDLGCGRGEWLQLLQEQGYEAIGIDTNSEAIRMCTSKGLRAECADILNYLAELKEESIDIITGFHIIEHLEYEELNQVIIQCNRVLKENGLIIFETPNPRNLIVGACNFYTDATHVKPVHPERIKFQLEYAGFYDIEYIYWQKSHIEYHEKLVKDIQKSQLSERIKGLLIQDSEYMNCPADYGIVGRKA